MTIDFAKIKKGDWVTFACGGKAQVEDKEHACIQFVGFGGLICYRSNGETKTELLNIVEITHE